MCFPLDYSRVKNVTSSSGVYVGLQTLADIDGERLWKKLYFRLAITLFYSYNCMWHVCSGSHNSFHLSSSYYCGNSLPPVLSPQTPQPLSDSIPVYCECR